MDVFEISQDRLYLLASAHIINKNRETNTDFYVGTGDLMMVAEDMVADGWLERAERTPGEQGRYRLVPEYEAFAALCHQVREDTRRQSIMAETVMVPVPGRGTVGRYWTLG